MPMAHVHACPFAANFGRICRIGECLNHDPIRTDQRGLISNEMMFTVWEVAFREVKDVSRFIAA